MASGVDAGGDLVTATAAPARPPDLGRRRRLEAAGALALFAVLAVVLVEHVWITRTGTVVGIGEDPKLLMWYLRWTPWAIAHGQDPLITQRILVPDGANLMWNASIILPSFLLWPVTALAGPEWSYDVLVTAAPALSAWVAYLALRRHASWLGSTSGALLYGFSPEIVAQSQGHPMVSIAILPPLALLLLEDIVSTASRRRRFLAGAGLGIASALQLLTGTEMLAITVICAAVGLAVLAALNPHEVRGRARGVAEGLAAAAIVGGVLGAFPLAVALVGPQHVSGALQVQDAYVQDLVGLVIPGQILVASTGHAAAIAAAATGNSVEVAGYLGIPLLVAAVAVSVALWRRPVVRWAALTATAIVVLALGPHLHIGGRVLHIPLPWRLVEGRPMVDSLLPARIMVVAYLPLALLVAVGIDAARAHRAAGVRIGAAVAAALVAISLWPRALAVQTPDTASFFTSGGVAGLPDGGVVVLSPETLGYSAMLDQALAGMRFRMPAGGAYVPGPRFGPAPSPLTDALRAAETEGPWALPPPDGLTAIRDEIRALGAQAIVIAPQPNEVRVVSLMTAVMDAPPKESGGVALWNLSGGAVLPR